MVKRKYTSEDEPDADPYKAAECPECGATLTARFARGRRTRRLRCPVCNQTVTVSPLVEEPQPALVQLRRADD